VTIPGINGLPAVDQATLPADVRNGSKADRDRYVAALGFERMLVAQLTQQLADTTKPSGDESGSAATSAYRQMLPGALADAVTAGGGLGLARQIADSLEEAGA
jgi:Rod binding domain-containing protein